MRQSMHAHLRPAFTLVELLIVIAIVGILVALVVPSLSQAREQGYKVSCLSNMRQQGIALNAYAMSWKNSIPPNCSRIDGVDATYGPYQAIGSGNRYAMGATVQTTARIDNSLTNDMAWASGLGQLWAGEYIPYTLDGARLLWCPANKTDNFFGNNDPAGIPSGPGRYWSRTAGNTSLKNNPYSCISGTGGGAQTVNFTYGYRSLGGPNGYTKGKWDIALMAKYVATADVCQNIYNNTKGYSLTRPNYSHGRAQGRYLGFNRLWYDGHAKWFDDANVAWEALCAPYGGLAHDTGFGNLNTETFWRLYDAN
jgi:prepilin-type N-terminal cleavage/methylation domain-containing protein